MLKWETRNCKDFSKAVEEGGGGGWYERIVTSRGGGGLPKARAADVIKVVAKRVLKARYDYASTA